MRMESPKALLAVLVFILVSVCVKGESDPREPDPRDSEDDEERSNYIVKLLGGHVEKRYYWHENWDLLPHEKCGQNNTNIKTKNPTLNGDANEGEFPWIVRYYTDGSNNKKMNCAGSIISRKYILTSAQCCEANKKSGVMPEIQIAPGQKEADYRLKAEKIVIHYAYKEKNKYKSRDDICLVRLENPYIQWPGTPAVSPICLPFYNRFENVDGSQMSLAGWGNYTPGVEELPSNLKKATLHVYDDQEKTLCKLGRRNKARRRACYFGRNFGFALIGEGNSASGSLGDYGAPLTGFDLKTRRWYLHGITQGKRLIGNKEDDTYYTLFTRVYDHLYYFILNNLEP